MAKFLGVVIDGKCSWEPQINALRLICASVTLYRVRDSIPKKMY